MKNLETPRYILIHLVTVHYSVWFISLVQLGLHTKRVNNLIRHNMRDPSLGSSEGGRTDRYVIGLPNSTS